MRWRTAPATSSTGSFIEASGYKLSEKDTKIGKIKLKKNNKGTKTKKGENKEKKKKKKKKEVEIERREEERREEKRVLHFFETTRYYIYFSHKAHEVAIIVYLLKL